MSRQLPLFIVDAFTESPFQGNPAAVCLLSKGESLSSEKMQTIGREMNLSETAFVEELDSPPHPFSPPPVQKNIKNRFFSLRWFTPTCEVALCGHATLASAHSILFEATQSDQKDDQQPSLHFYTLSGELIVTTLPNSPGYLQLDFPNGNPQKIEDLQLWPRDLLSKLVDLHKIGNVVESCLCRKTKKLLIRLSNYEDIFHLCPSGEVINVPLPEDVKPFLRGIIVTASTKDGPSHSMRFESEFSAPISKFDFISRYFASWAGIPEDPVTGSAHTVLAPYWKERADQTFFGVRGGEELIGFQASPNRGGQVRVQVDGDRVFLRGKAVTTVRGSLCL